MRCWWRRGPGAGLLEDLPIVPVKGEMIALAPPTGAALPGPVMWGEHVYCVPRHGRLLVGATVEEAGFDTSIDQGRRAITCAPRRKADAGAEGLGAGGSLGGPAPQKPGRPAAAGRTATPGLFVAGGQYRNGILFAPAIAAEMADLMLGKGVGHPSFRSRRFGRFA